MTGTLARYFGMRFLATLIAVLAGVFALVILLDYVEMMRRLGDAPNASALKVAQTSLFRVPQITERVIPEPSMLSIRDSTVANRDSGFAYSAPNQVSRSRKRVRSTAISSGNTCV